MGLAGQDRHPSTVNGGLVDCPALVPLRPFASLLAVIQANSAPAGSAFAGKTVVDCFKFRNQIGIWTAAQAPRRSGRRERDAERHSGQAAYPDVVMSCYTRLRLRRYC